MKGSTIAEREAVGRAARERSKRSSHRAVGEIRRDPLELIRQSSEGRIRKLVALRYGRMAASPLAFLRGSAILQAHDLGQVPHTDLVLPICGDSHLLNFGGFSTPDRQLVFDVNDFDEVSHGPFEWDLKRLVASFAVTARQLGFSRGAAHDAVMSAVLQYRDRVAQYAQSGTLELWYERITFDRMIEAVLAPEGRRRIRRGMEKAAGRIHEGMLDKVVERVDDRLVMRDLPGLFHVHVGDTLFTSEDDGVRIGDGHKLIDGAYADYLQTLPPDRRELLAQFTIQDFSFKVAGIGSLGARCFVLLATDPSGKPLFLQLKEALPSVVARFFKSKEPRHEGERVVRAQQMLQATSDIFLGWATGPGGRPFYVRQLFDMKMSPNLEHVDTELLNGYARVCGWALARAHARASGKAIEIAAYIGRNDQFAEALADYAFAYADQVERDYDAFLKACRSGALDARTDEDMAADFRV
ncbi:DUF2252 domain-containing protein [Paraburkholderia rhizosphaerae]|uniref:Uncharacterized protein (DUF2252 family) n=1 Tax=Paraburkholderia rhizosphaerae TaxID=480658 RepID=A0A4R8LZ80_9BURK|nr:DUF2252 domain-containing protein [Paraburkholderia rhizosphaerae]TDY53971.1 uncharacterized protein (DUF2252 family) [Paraburkholderia rhizosphaerae]